MNEILIQLYSFLSFIETPELPANLLTQLPENLEPQLAYGIMATIIIRLIIMLICMAISYALAPDPDEGKSATIEEYNVPTAEVGRPIPVLFGRKIIRGPNVVWYGDFMCEDYKK